jgi:hypothetical protein
VNRRLISAAAAGFLGLLPVLVATPASASDAVSSVVCPTGSSCEIQLENMIRFKGDDNHGGNRNVVVNIAPPPCLWNPIGDATTGSQTIIGEFGNNPAATTTMYQVDKSVAKANQLLAANPKPPGEWYELPINPAAGAAGAAECLKLPLFAWVPPGTAPPGINIPPETLAQLALVRIRVPGKGKMTLSPKGNDAVNLPTFVRVALAGGVHYANGMPYTRITATLGNVSATVWIKPTPLQLSAPGATTDANNCGYLGSNMLATNPGAVARTGINGAIDCGVTFRQPGALQLTASINWQTCWVAAVDNGVPPPACTPVPGAQLNPTVWNRQVNVKEIQAANGAG